MATVHSPTASRRRLAVRLLLGLGATLGVGLAILAGNFAWVNRDGERVWSEARAELAAQGEWKTAAQLMPPSVPDEDNLAKIPLLTPLFDYELLADDTIRWKGDEAQGRIVSGPLFSVFATNQPGSKPRLGSWESGKTTDLQAWRDYYAESSEFSHPVKGGTPGRDVLSALSRDAVALAQLREGMKRPFCRFPVRLGQENTLALPLPHLALLRRLNTYLGLSSLAHLAEHDPTAAGKDLETAFRLQKAIQEEPILMSFLVRLPMLQTVTQVIWEGIARGQWDGEGLERIQASLQSLDIIAHQRLILQGERGFMNLVYDRWMGSRDALKRDLSAAGGGKQISSLTRAFVLLAPQGVLRQNQAIYNRLLTQAIDAVRTGRKSEGGYRPYTESEMTDRLRNYCQPKSMNNFLVRFLAPGVEQAVTRGLAGQARRDLALVAVALERYRLAKGRLPENLGELRPEWLSAIPDDIFTGAPLKYQRLAKGGFVLYSLGPNGRDDGGEWTPEAKGERKQPDQDDLVWKYPKE